ADPLGHVTTSTYAGHGNRTGVTNALNQTAAAYDGTGQLTSVTAADTAATTMGYDGAGRLTSITDPL
ncbi:MAG: RHS repeat domain-containing protein, partial [Chloroflexota bacterium]